MAKLIVIQGGREKTFDLLDDVTFVGSGEDCGIRLRGEGVKAQHFQILKVDGGHRIVNLGGDTRVNGHGVAQHTLANGDVIHVGDATLTFRGGIQPAAISASGGEAEKPLSPLAAAAARAKAEGGGGGATTRRGRRGSTGRRGGRAVEVSSRMQQAAGQRDVLTRRNVRKAGLSGPATIAIATGVSLVVIIAGYLLLKGMPSDQLGETLARAQELYKHDKYEEAKALLATIPADAANYRVAQDLLKEWTQVKEVGIDLKAHQWGVREYENNIIPFLEGKVRTDDPKYAGDGAYTRVLVKRMKAFLKEYPEHKYEANVKALLSEYEPQVKGEPTWHDIAVEAESERDRNLYGPAYLLVDGWLGENESTGDKYEVEQATRLKAKIERSAKQWWEDQQNLARDNIRRSRFNDAYSKFMVGVRRFEGWPEMQREAQALADNLKDRIDEVDGSK